MIAVPSSWSYCATGSVRPGGAPGEFAKREAVGAGALELEAARVERERPLLDTPAVVRARRAELDLLDVVLADVADPQVAVHGVEREPERVAQPVGEDLGQRAGRSAGLLGEVPGRDAVRPRGGRMRIDPQHLAERRVDGLAVARLRVAEHRVAVEVRRAESGVCGLPARHGSVPRRNGK